MYNSNAQKMYQQNSVLTATPAELTLLLYDNCLKFIKFASKAIEVKNIEMKNQNLQKAQSIINELMVTLDMDVDISHNMLQLYDYMNRRLVEANIKNDVAILTEVEEFVKEFRDTWKQMIQETKTASVK